MATNSEVREIIDLMDKFHEKHIVHIFEDSNKGALAVIKFLENNNGVSTNGEISDFLGVSTARVAVLLKKLEEKEILKRSVSVKDARITIVSFTDKGKKVAQNKKKELENKVSKIIDALGIEKIREHHETINIINHIMENDDNKIKGDNK